MKILDTQVHIQEVGSSLRPPNDALRPMSIDEIEHEMDGAGVAQAFLNHRSWERYRNDLATAAAHRSPARFAVMATFDIADEAAVAALPRTWPFDPAMVGIRLNYVREHAELARKGLDEPFWCAANRLGLKIMIQPGEALGRVREVLTDHPAVRITIDHLGLQVGGSMDSHRQSVSELVSLSAFENLSVKASALPCYAADDYPHVSMHSLVRPVIEAFGSSRVFWGSDMSRLPGSYANAVTMFTQEMPWLDGVSLARVMGDAAREWFGWPAHHVLGAGEDANRSSINSTDVGEVRC